MASERFHNVGVTYLKCDHVGCNGGLEQARMQGWWTYGEVLCPTHNPMHQPVTQTVSEYWGNKFGWNNAT